MDLKARQEDMRFKGESKKYDCVSTRENNLEGLKTAEKMVLEALKDSGAKEENIFHKGWPDFAVFYEDTHLGYEGGLFFIEVKQGSDAVKPHQERLHSILRAKGFKVILITLPRGVSYLAAAVQVRQQLREFGIRLRKQTT